MSCCAIIFLAALTVVVASPVSTTGGKQDISSARRDAEQRLRTALEGADGSVFWAPLRRLRELESGGIRDQDAIAAYTNSQKVSEYLTFSVKFWISKMEEVIKPYVTNPAIYKGMVVEPIFAPEDPTWNDKYREAERQIKETVEAAVEDLKQKYARQQRKTTSKKIEDVTYSSWARVQMDRELQNAETGVKNSGQWAKQRAADGKTEEALADIRRVVDNTKAEFDKITDIIVKEYQTNIKH